MKGRKRELGSDTLEGDGTQTLLRTWLSGVLLVGLVVNSTLDWNWADSVAALVIAAVAARAQEPRPRAGQGSAAATGAPTSAAPSNATTAAAPVSLSLTRRNDLS